MLMKQKYYVDFISKKQFYKWLEEMEDKIDWDEGITLDFAYNHDEIEEQYEIKFFKKL